ncbi:Early nodulin-like protein 3 [Bienertia sinuspersici]
MRQVGGKFYTIRAILQEMQHNLKVSATSKDEDNLTIGKKVQVKGISDVGVTSQCHVSDDAIAVVDKIAVSTEYDISHDDVMDEKSQKMVNVSYININHENTTENVSRGERKAGLELGGESNMVSANKVTSDNNRVPESKEVLVLASTVENASSNEIVTMVRLSI